MTPRTRKLGRILLVLGLGAAALGAGAPGAAAGGPVRHGRIMVAFRPTYGLGPIAGCMGVPDCLLWQQSCQRPAARNTGLTSSIVDVRSLAGSTRTLRVPWGQPGATEAFDHTVTVEFWNASCAFVAAERDLSDVWSGTSFAIPRAAAWMTVTSPCHWIGFGYNGVALRWNLF